MPRCEVEGCLVVNVLLCAVRSCGCLVLPAECDRSWLRLRKRVRDVERPVVGVSGVSGVAVVCVVACRQLRGCRKLGMSERCGETVRLQNLTAWLSQLRGSL